MNRIQSFLYDSATDKNRGFFAFVFKLFFFILSLIYGLGIRILIFLYSLNPYRLDCKVISVGNITLGGTGKTSLVESIARFLKTQGHKVAILTRGYGRASTDDGRRTTEYGIMGDEPYMLSKNLGDIPVIVDADRVRGAKKAIKDFGVDTVILDDGFQQWKIKKDLEIVAIDANNPFGNRHMIPRGILREPLSSLKRADMFILTKTNLVGPTEDIRNCLSRINPRAVIFESEHEPVGFHSFDKPKELLNLETLKGKTAYIFCGIGNPDSFERLIKSLGVKVGLSIRFPDHYNYTRDDLDKIFKDSQGKNINAIITTEKDAARLYGIRTTEYGIRILILRIRIKITKNEQEFYNRLLKLYFL